MKLLLYLSHCKCKAESGVCAWVICVCGVFGLFVQGTVLRGRVGICPQKDFAKFFSSVLKLSY